MIQLPADTSANVTTDAPCTVSVIGGEVLVGRPSSGTCQVRVQMTNGATYASQVQFSGGEGCCPYTYFGTAGPLEPIDAGTGD